MKEIMEVILEILYCLVALSATGMFLTNIYTDLKRNQRDAELEKRRDKREEEEHRGQMELYRR